MRKKGFDGSYDDAKNLADNVLVQRGRDVREDQPTLAGRALQKNVFEEGEPLVRIQTTLVLLGARDADDDGDDDDNDNDDDDDDADERQK